MNQELVSARNLELGYELIEAFLTQDQLTHINSEIDGIEIPALAGGVRNAEKKLLSVRNLIKQDKLRSQAGEYLAGTANLVRAILFDKTAENNWLVAWHQDRTVAVSERFEKDGWTSWSIKDASHHVHPPLDVLNQMVTFRIHLDDTSQENGCLKVLPNSQRLGVLDHAAIQEYVKTHEPVICEAQAGSALVMRPNILHSSCKASKPSRRRVLHLEYSDFKLPEGVTWA